MAEVRPARFSIAVGKKFNATWSTISIEDRKQQNAEARWN
jgi:hypothetical protein